MNKKVVTLIITGLILFVGTTIFVLNINTQDYPKTYEWNIYKVNNFSFEYPENLKISKSLEKGGEIVAVENNNFGFQIFILPFNEMGPITTERILKDLPNMKISNSAEADIEGVESLVLYGYIDGLGETFEAWVVYKDKLYQIMTSRIHKKALLEVLYTWKWE